MPSETLKDVYIEEMRDLWSANDQMQRLMRSMSQKASNQKLKKLLDQSVSGIEKHTEALKSVLEAQGGKIGKEQCRGMEGLVAEAKKHAVDADLEGSLRDLAIIAQYHACRITALRASVQPRLTPTRLGGRTMQPSSRVSSKRSIGLMNTVPI